MKTLPNMWWRAILAVSAIIVGASIYNFWVVWPDHRRLAGNYVFDQCNEVVSKTFDQCQTDLLVWVDAEFWRQINAQAGYTAIWVGAAWAVFGLAVWIRNSDTIDHDGPKPKQTWE